MIGIRTINHPLSLSLTAVMSRWAAIRGRQVNLATRDLYGFVPADAVEEVMQDRSGPSRIHFISTGSVAALAGPLALRLPVRNRVRHALGKLRIYRRVLEDVMRQAPVLPARFGSRLPGRSSILRAVEDNESSLAEAVGAFGHLRQMEIRVTAPCTHPGACSRVHSARNHVRAELRSLSLGLHEEAAREETTLLSVTLLLRPLDEPRLDAALARLDGEYGGWLHFNCVGPLPPCNFIRVRALHRSGPSRHPDWTLALDSTLPGNTILPPPSRAASAGSRAA